MADDPKRDAEIEALFWKALRKDMTVMLGLANAPDTRPMAAQLATDEDRGPVWFFSGKDSELFREVSGQTPAQFTFVSKGHDVWASVTGTLQLDMDRAMIEKLWNPYVAAWYPDGKDDANLALLRFDTKDAKIWKDGSSLVAGVLSLLGRDPGKDYESNVAEVSLR